MPREESSFVPETEPLLLPKNDFARPANILCASLSSLEASDEVRVHSDSDIRHSSPTTTDMHQYSSSI